MQERYISLKLFYYDELTPADYQPKCFEDATNEEHQFFETSPLKVNVGSITSVSWRVLLFNTFYDIITSLVRIY